MLIPIIAGNPTGLAVEKASKTRRNNKVRSIRLPTRPMDLWNNLSEPALQNDE